jgi:F0F1-type ATP synthase assembly protein I
LSTNAGEPNGEIPSQEGKSNTKDFPGAVEFLTMGMSTAIVLAVFVVLGIWVDHSWGTAPWGLFFGIALGTVAAVVSVVKQIRRFL